MTAPVLDERVWYVMVAREFLCLALCEGVNLTWLRRRQGPFRVAILCPPTPKKDQSSRRPKTTTRALKTYSFK